MLAAFVMAAAAAALPAELPPQCAASFAFSNDLFRYRKLRYEGEAMPAYQMPIVAQADRAREALSRAVRSGDASAVRRAFAEHWRLESAMYAAVRDAELPCRLAAFDTLPPGQRDEWFRRLDPLPPAGQARPLPPPPLPAPPPQVRQ